MVGFEPKSLLFLRHDCAMCQEYLGHSLHEARAVASGYVVVVSLALNS